MKKLMRFTAVLASAVMLCANCPAGYTADSLWYFGFTANGVFQQMQMLDANGWLQDYVLRPHEFTDADENTPYYICTYHLNEVEKSDPEYYIWADPMYLTVPLQKRLQFVLNSDLNRDAAIQQAEEIVREHFPECTLSKNDRIIQVRELDEAMRTAENAAVLMRDLAQAGLISEFYSWGETAEYKVIEHGFLTVYDADGYIREREQENGKTYDWAAIEAWVRAHHPECEFVSITDKDSELELGNKLCKSGGYGTKLLWGKTFYAVIPPEDISFADHFALAMELYEQFGLSPCAWPTSLESEPGQMFGKNGLEVAGDANLDCSVDVSDAVLAARFAAEDREAVITDQGKLNADYNGDGNVTTDDTELILKKIAKKI